MSDDAPIDLAGELAIGLLEGQELRAAREREAREPAFAAEVARWRGRLAALVEEVPELAAPPSAWPRIERSTGAPTGDNVVQLRRRVNLWRGATAAATALAASLALVIATRDVSPPVAPAVPPPAEVMVAMIKAGREVAAVASWDRGSNRLVVSAVNMPSDPRHDYQLWLIPAGGTPHSIGVMPDAPHVQVAVAEPMTAMMAEGATLAVSVEPPGGSPTNGPTGPVVASGPITRA